MLKISENGDLHVVNKRYTSDETMHTILISSIFTDARHGDRGGYWIPLVSSELWRFQKAKATREDLAEMLVYINDTLKILAQKGYFISAQATIPKINNEYVVEINVKLYDNTLSEVRKYHL